MNNHLSIEKLFKERAYLVREHKQISENQASNLIKSTENTNFLNIKNIAQDLKTTSKILEEVVYKNGLVLIYEKSLPQNYASNPSTINVWTKGLVSNFKGSKKTTLKTIPSFVIAFPKSKKEAYYISTELNKKSILFTIVGPPHMQIEASPYHIDAQTDLPELAKLYLNFFKIAINRGHLKRALQTKKEIRTS